MNSSVKSMIMNVDQVGTYTIKKNSDDVLNVELITKTVGNMYSDTF